MPTTRLILHVKGTEAETAEYSRTVVRAAISQGQLTQSQLIWSPANNAWKQVRELPDLMPGETLILHVKGTESETKQLPKQAVRAAISKGQLTHSQLIWIPSDNAWKQVRELPDLLPGESLILHVKGTEAETREVPKRAVRTAISHGEITHSQLIWSPANNAWKQVRELPDLLPSQKLAPAPTREAVVPVAKAVEPIIPESPTGPVARAVAAASDAPRVRVAVATGAPPKVRVMAAAAAAAAGVPRVRVAAAADVPRIHVEATSDAPQVRVAAVADTPQVQAEATSDAPQVRVAAVTDIPQAQAEAAAEEPQAQAPAADAAPQAHVAATAATPQVRAAVPGTTTLVRIAAASAPQVRVAAASAGTRQVRVVAATPVFARPTGSLEVKDEDGPHLLKWLCIGMGVLILLVLGGNYLLVDQPLVSNLDKTNYSNVTVYAHLGAFMQPNVMVIHIPPSSAITPDKLPDFLVALAHSTPQDPLTHDLFGRVAVTSGWTAQYSFSGYSWKQLGELGNDGADQQKEALMERLGDASGRSLLPESTLNEEAQQATRDKVWNDFVNHFTAQR